MLSTYRKRLALEPLESRRLLSATPIAQAMIPPDQVEVFVAAYSPPYDLADTFSLHSNPSAGATIYLDFDGHTTTGTWWNTNYNEPVITTPAFSADSDPAFSDDERAMIQHIWQQVCEDFAPFDLDVTTEDPGAADLSWSGPGDTGWGIRVCIGGSSDDWLGPAGVAGMSITGSFDRSTDAPCFAFSESLPAYSSALMTLDQIGRTVSHEVGHSLGLGHDGSSANEYYRGHGFDDGPISWSAIMGSSLAELTQWSIGDYPDATNQQDDLAIITSQNQFGYRTDDHGDTTASATTLGSGTALSAEGIIERTTDLDFFSFEVSASSPVTIVASPFEVGPNLDIELKLYDAAGVPIATNNPRESLGAFFEVNLSPGTYYVSIDGGSQPAGTGDDYGWSDYGSLGQYELQVLIDPAPLSRIYVDDDAAEGGDGYSWAAAMPSLEAALRFAESVNGVGPAYDDVTEIWIAEGTYAPTNPTSSNYDRTRAFRLVDGVSLLGGFAGTEASEDERVIGDDRSFIHESILTGNLTGELAGQQAYRVVVAESLSQPTRLDGLVVTGGSADLEGFFPNGGGIHVSAVDDLIIQRSIISSNYSIWNGGGVYVADGSGVTIVSSKLTDNSAATYGGGIYVSSGSVDLIGSFVAGNQGDWGAGILVSSGAQLLVSSSTIANNTASGYAGGIFTNGTVSLFNSIVAHNQASDYVDLYGTYAATSSNNLVRNASNVYGLSAATNILGSSSSPRSAGFIDLASGDFRLTSGSDAIDAASASLLPVDTLDLDGDGNTAEPLSRDAYGGARVVGAELDIGAWELPPTVNMTGSISVDEGDWGSSLASLTVTLSQVASSDVSVTFHTTDGSATAGEDYAATSGTVVFLPGETSTTIDIPIFGDMTKEDDETLTVTLDGSLQAVIGSATATISILNDDDSKDVALKFMSEPQPDPMPDDPSDVGPIICEWTAFTIEVWFDPAETMFDAVELSLLADTSLFVPSLGEITAGPLFAEGSGTLLSSLDGDVLTLSGTTDSPQTGTGGYVLLAQVPISPIDPAGGMTLPTDLSRPAAAEYSVELILGETTFGGATAHGFALANDARLDVYPAIYDLDDNGQVGVGDLALFASVYGQTTASASNPLVVLADFDGNEQVGVGDLALFASNYGASAAKGSLLAYPSGFPWAVSAMLPAAMISPIAQASIAPSEPGTDTTSNGSLTDAVFASPEISGFSETDQTARKAAPRHCPPFAVPYGQRDPRAMKADRQAELIASLSEELIARLRRGFDGRVDG